MFTVARISNQIGGNNIAWSTPIESFPTLEEAKVFEGEEWQRMCAAFDELPKGEGFVMAEGIFIHDGENVY